jgi:hypothetical protein
MMAYTVLNIIVRLEQHSRRNLSELRYLGRRQWQAGKIENE